MEAITTTEDIEFATRLPRHSARDRRGRFARRLLSTQCTIEALFVGDGFTSHSHAGCPEIQGQVAAEGSEAQGWLCTTCIGIETIPWAELIGEGGHGAGAGGAKGEAVRAWFAAHGEGTAKQVAAEVGCAVSRVHEVLKALGGTRLGNGVWTLGSVQA